MRRGEVRAGFCWGKLKERDPLKDLDVVGKIILKWVLNLTRAWTTFMWLRIGTGGGIS
jgi:hypothetical protein